MDPTLIPVLLAAGLATGFVNVVAAGGSLISMPVLILLGLPPATANGTNRIAILVQNATAVTTFHRRGHSDPRTSLTLALCTVPGAVLGAWAAIAIDPVLFERILGGVLIAAVVLIVFRPGGAGADPRPTRPVVAHLAVAAAGVYGGFMQAGVGFLLMPILHHLLRLDLVRVNMHKVFIIGAYNIPALLVFALRGHVWWIGGAALAAGNALGAWLGTRATVAGGDRLVRTVFAIAVLAMAAKLLTT